MELGVRANRSTSVGDELLVIGESRSIKVVRQRWEGNRKGRICSLRMGMLSDRDFRHTKPANDINPYLFRLAESTDTRRTTMHACAQA